MVDSSKPAVDIGMHTAVPPKPSVRRAHYRDREALYPDSLELQEAAAVLHCHPKTLRLLAKAAKIPGKNVGVFGEEVERVAGGELEMIYRLRSLILRNLGWEIPLLLPIFELARPDFIARKITFMHIEKFGFHHFS